MTALNGLYELDIINLLDIMAQLEILPILLLTTRLPLAPTMPLTTSKMSVGGFQLALRPVPGHHKHLHGIFLKRSATIEDLSETRRSFSRNRDK